MDALRLSYEKTGVIPPALARKPELTDDCIFYLEAFYFLSGFRPEGMSGLGPLLLADIERYAALSGYTSANEILFFADVMLACDVAFRNYHAKKSSAKSAAKPKK